MENYFKIEKLKYKKLFLKIKKSQRKILQKPKLKSLKQKRLLKVKKSIKKIIQQAKKILKKKTRKKYLKKIKNKQIS